MNDPDEGLVEIPKPDRREPVGGRMILCDSCGEQITGEVSIQRGKPFCYGCWVFLFGEG